MQQDPLRDRRSIIIGGLLVVVVIGGAVWAGLNTGGDTSDDANQLPSIEEQLKVEGPPAIGTYEDCVQADGAILIEGPPRRCSLPGAEVWTEGQ